MSQHHYQTGWYGHKIEINIGWDRPLGGYYMVINSINTDTYDIIWSNLYLDVPHPKTVQPFLDILCGMGISLPAEMVAELIRDSITNCGNKNIMHELDKDAYVRVAVNE